MRPERPVVLIVDDELATAQLMQEMLKRDDYAVECVDSGAAALARVEAGGVDLVLLDVLMPDMTGLEVCRRVREQAGELYLPIIMVTGLTGDTERHEGFAAGADDYVTKPFRMEELLDRVCVWIRTRQYLQVSQTRKEELAQDQTTLAMALTTSHDLIRLLMLMLNLLEFWEDSGDSPADRQRLRGELREAALALAARINTLTSRARAAPGLGRASDS